MTPRVGEWGRPPEGPHYPNPAFLVFLQRQRLGSARGTRRVSAAPRYHPLCPPGEPLTSRVSPAVGLPGKNRRKGYGASRSRSDPLNLALPVLLGHRPAASRARTRAGGCLSSGRSGVIWSAAHAPGLAPSPGRLALRSAAAVPFKAPSYYPARCARPRSPPCALRSRRRRGGPRARISFGFGALDGGGARARCCCVGTLTGLSRRRMRPRTAFSVVFHRLRSPAPACADAGKAAGILLTPNEFAGEAAEPYSPLSVRIYDPRNEYDRCAAQRC